MVDSGAYSAFNSGVNIKIKDYLSFISDISVQDTDIIVNLDVIGNQEKSKLNWTYLSKKLDVLPVIHLPNLEDLYPSEKYIGLGGMVPSFKINQKGSVHDVATWVASLTQNKKYHAFGIGSPYHQIAFNEFLQSADWIGWRRNAAVCSCYTPEGSVYIHEARKKKKRGRSMTTDLFQRYSPPFIDSYEKLCKKGTEGWINRALWNVWAFLHAEDYEKEINSSRYVISLKKRLHENTIFPNFG
ncbi:MAG: hypothetical protein JSV04_10585 [Candidatus Heimdallarchaeota archaeon]|nr:MAG: hypothetical protein JSV04_10585 [Candidatus Heimdallarchaeota archaeon]